MLKFYGLVAQSVEQRIENPCVAGSTPAEATIRFVVSLQINTAHAQTAWPPLTFLRSLQIDTAHVQTAWPPLDS